VLRTRRPLLALVLLVVLLAGGYLLSAVRSDPGQGGAAGPSATSGSTVGPTGSPSPGATGTPRPGRTTAPGGGLATVAASALPAEARRTLQLIEQGGPFPYERDGTVFGNLERLLPRQERGWYREYTVRTPGERDRGARRIVAGRDGTCYYTADHYESFAIVDEGR
jgi:ribonuclease T1